MKQKNNIRHLVWYVFLAVLASRLLFILVSGMSPFDATPDTLRYDKLSDRIIEGHFNMDIGIFIVAPFYPWFLAGFKWLFGTVWLELVVVVQLLLSALSGVYLWKIASRLLNSETGLLTVIFFCFFPFTMWYTHALLQEGFFQSFLIFTIYYLIKSIESSNWKALMIAAVLFSVTFLTKSYILLFSPFIALMFFLNRKNKLKHRLIQVAVFAGISLFATLPYGLYNLKVNNTYTLSSNGFGKMLWYGNSEFAYSMHTVYLTPEHPKYEEINSDTTMLLMKKEEEFRRENFDLFSWLKTFPMDTKQRQAFYLNKAKDWVQNNPQKFLHLKWINFKRFFTPGVSRIHYSFQKWLVVLLISLPIYVFAFWGFWKSFKVDFQRHSWFFYLLLSMLLFTLIYGMQSRFRSITLEPYYLIYAAFGVLSIFPKLKARLNKFG